jgi:ribosomal protein L23
MIIEPSSIVKVLRGVPLDIAHKNVAYYNNVSDQLEALTEYVKYTLSGCTYIKEGNKIRMNRKADDLYDCNYLMYQNPAYGLKWFFAFITDIEYKNNSQCDISFIVDDAQTWLVNEDYKVMPSFVEREHVTDDTIGTHILDECLALNDFVTTNFTAKWFTDWWVCIGTTVELTPPEITPRFPPIGGAVYAGIYSGVAWYCYSLDKAMTELPYMLQALATDAKSDSIISMFMIPKDIVSINQVDMSFMRTDMRPAQDIPVLDTKALDGYTPRNKKLLTYPYRSLVLSNNEGNAVTLRYEFFAHGVEPVIKYVGGIQPNSKIIAYPQSYKGQSQNLEESVSVGNFPQACWQQNAYAEWFAQQSIRWGYQEDRMFRNALVNIGSKVAGGAMAGTLVGPEGTLGGAGIGAIIGVASEANNIVNFYSQMAEEKEVHSHVPNSVKGTIGNGYTNISIGKYGFQVEERTIKEEVAKSIDGYFDMFGYKVNILKVPNISTRPHWNYVKTIGVTLRGDIPADALIRLSAMYNNGVTFWKDITEIGNYELDNTI